MILTGPTPVKPWFSYMWVMIPWNEKKAVNWIKKNIPNLIDYLVASFINIFTRLNMILEFLYIFLILILNLFENFTTYEKKYTKNEYSI